jgi:hypothetical protein
MSGSKDNLQIFENERFGEIRVKNNRWVDKIEVPHTQCKHQGCHILITPYPH